MATRKTIANLAAFITADAVQFAGEFQKADQIVARFSKNMQKELGKGFKLGVGLFGAGTVLSLISAEIKHVIADIDSIPGVPQTTVASIHELREGFSEVRNSVDWAFSGIVAYAHMAAQSIGALFAVIHGADANDVTAGLSKQSTPDEQKRAIDPHFDEKITAAADKLRKARIELSTAGETRAEQFNRLVAESERLKKFADSSSIDSVEKLDAQTDATKRLTEAQKIMNQIGAETKSEYDKHASILREMDSLGGTNDMRLSKLNEQRRKILEERSRLNSAGFSSGTDEVAKAERILELNKELNDVDQNRLKVMKRMQDLAVDMGEAVGKSLEDAVFSGRNLHDVFTSLIKDIAQILFRKMIVNPIVNSISGGIGSLFSGLFRAGGGPVRSGDSYIVGEEGPEVFKPNSNGTIIPNNALVSAPEASGRGNTYIIDARGTDIGVVNRIENALYALAGPGVVEKRALAAAYDSRRRGGF